MKKSATQPYVLGLDIGANSIGWAILDLDGRSPTGVKRAGVRVFEAGLQGDISTGRGESRNVTRRAARLHRRRLDRLARRLNVLFHLLQDAGLLPRSADDADASQQERDKKSSRERHEVLTALNGSLSASWQEKLSAKGLPEQVVTQIAHTLPYFLRARALDERLTPQELGRVLYHLGQRRGFLSNRKQAAKKEDGVVKKQIGELAQEMEKLGSRTLGEYFSTLHPEEERIRNRYTSRKMYEEEFGKIWEVQRTHHPDVLSDDFKKKVHHAIFYQRPLKWDRGTIGDCELEPGRKRAPWALLVAQRFRLLDRLNNLRIETADGRARELTGEEHGDVLSALEIKGDQTFKKIRRLLRLRDEDGFNLEEGGEKKIPGDRTTAKIVKVFGRKRWEAFSREDRERIVDDLRSIEKPETLKRRGVKAWGLNEDEAEVFSKLTLESDYCSLSRQAIEKVLPLLEEGLSFAEARKKVYGERPELRPVHFLPQVEKALPALRNPVVARALTELRRVVNAIVRTYGKPRRIRVELARDLRKTKKQRAAMWKRNRENQKTREDAAARICKELGIAEPKRADILKVVLAEECNWECTYTGKHISMRSLLGDNPQFDIEHIIPFSRCLDNSFMNKTLCEVRENRAVKKNQTPYEAYASRPDRWAQVIERVRRFKGGARFPKLQRFLLQDLQSIEDFTTQQLNDTRYASRLATEYLGVLYGGQIDSEGTRRIQVNRGGTTAFFRNEWGLNDILGDVGKKSRDDHRHHAVDALVVALAGPDKVKMLSDAARGAPVGGRKLFKGVKPPWPGFLDEAYRAVDRMVVSHAVSRKVNGPLHEETVYGPPQKTRDGQSFVSVRKPIQALSTNEVEEIADPIVREAVKQKLGVLDGEPKAVFKATENHPSLETKDGREVPVHKVRLHKNVSTVALAPQKGPRHVKPGSNHHLEIFEVETPKGPKWEAEIVTRYEAMRRLRDKEPVIRRRHGGGGKFLFSLAPGEIIELDENGKRTLFQVRSVSQAQGQSPRIEYVYINDARKQSDIKKSKVWRTALIAPLGKLNCQKVVITPLGEVRRAND